MLPFSVLIPTRNSMRYLPDHIRSLKSWSDLAQEIVVVDSYSQDGTLEYIRDHLKHPNLRTFQHPPGLYQSWNFGINQLQSTYTYISTVGDSIFQTGIKHLVSVSEKLRCDVLISPPQLIDTENDPVSQLRWPIHDIIDSLNIATPRALNKYEAFFFAVHYAVGHGLSGILGSAASNLYRTRTLKQFPFPTDCGNPGDTAWGVLNSLNVKFGLTPMVCSTFLFHPKEDGTAGDHFNEDLSDRLSKLANEIFERELLDIARSRSFKTKFLIFDLLHERRQYHHYRDLLKSYRQRSLPWFVQIAAWGARVKRNYHQKRFECLRGHIKNPDWCQFIDNLSSGKFRWPES
jgi:glycosyltransferase involved in cell wall biosynthesis